MERGLVGCSWAGGGSGSEGKGAAFTHPESPRAASALQGT